MKSEDEVLQLIRLDAPKRNVVLWRNNSGALLNPAGRPIRFGLGNDSPNSPLASSDLIGLIYDQWGTLPAIFLAIEVKKEGWKYKGDERETAQKAFIDFVITKGGRAGFAQSVEDFWKIIGN